MRDYTEPCATKRSRPDDAVQVANIQDSPVLPHEDGLSCTGTKRTSANEENACLGPSLAKCSRLSVTGTEPAMARRKLSFPPVVSHHQPGQPQSPSVTVSMD